ncbi:MAG: hypothetical protein GX578_01530 [Clostridiales bacterium]|nr:hypothetical protein [Clostridiales bacterium]
MEKADASFTFIDRVEEIELNIDDGRWQSALALALTLPDICGGIAFPEVVKKYKNGRIMLDNEGKPARDTGRQYILWFDTYASGFFLKEPGDEDPYIDGEKCWQLRCEYLHQNKGFDNESDENEVHFHLGINCGSTVCSLDTESVKNGIENIRLDIRELCRRSCLAARAYYDKLKYEKDFDLYNTPVIDFLKWKEEQEPSKKSILILTEDRDYGKGLQLALKTPNVQTVFCAEWEEAKEKLRRRRPTVWIIDEAFIHTKVIKSALSKSEKVFVITGNEETDTSENRDIQTLPKAQGLKELRDRIRSLL